ncbi:MAG: hypothetical protein E6J30_10995 [Chloroflexi bacterium]|nr:MAG: hypothetical protein E6J30_10995 [Chloroflexota bacterium]
MRLTLLDLLEATGGGEVGGTQVGERYSTYHTDSREVQTGGVFFALRGAEMDGHKFVKDAIARGAAAVVVERRLEAPSGIVEIVVPDTWKALYDVAALVLSRVKCRCPSCGSSRTTKRWCSRWGCSVRATSRAWSRSRGRASASSPTPALCTWSSSRHRRTSRARRASWSRDFLQPDTRS